VQDRRAKLPSEGIGHLIENAVNLAVSQTVGVRHLSIGYGWHFCWRHVRVLSGSGIAPLRRIGARERLLIVAVSFGPAKLLDSFDQNFVTGPLRFAEELHNLGNIGGERHRMRISGLLRAKRFGLNVGRCEFQDLYGGFFDLMAERLQPGVQKRLGCRIGGELGVRYEGET
jgi:hypothetical protein